MASLRYYLENIKLRKPINYEQFVSKLPDEFRSNANNSFDKNLISAKPKRWIVNCDDETFDKLWTLSEPTRDRVHASQQGNSHNHRVTANLVMVYHKAVRKQIPDIVYVSSLQTIQNFESQPRLLLIENEENFIRYNDFCSVVSEFLGYSVDIGNTDIAFGGGNRITSYLLFEWYANYKEILCAFDYDLGGLKMFKTLRKQMGEKVSFVQPFEYIDIINLFKKEPDSDEKLIKCISLAKELDFKELARTISETRCFMEQEILLDRI